jgi:aryl-alcohol dehydrogenase-like predicted oxidoreductase
MDYRPLGGSGLMVSALSLGTGTFGGGTAFFRTVAQVALNSLLQRPTVSSVIIGARDEGQLRQNLGALGWALTADQMGRLDAASARTPAYPYWHQRGVIAARTPPAV